MAFIPNSTNPQTFSTLTPNGMGNLPMPKNGPTPVTPPSPMGAQAPSPQKNIKKPTNVLPQTNQTGATTGQTATANNGLIGSPDIFQRAGNAQLDIGFGQNPDVQSRIQDISDLNSKYYDKQAAIGSEGYTSGIRNNLDQYYSDRYQKELGNKQMALLNTFTGQGQQISALGNTASQNAPQQVAPGNFYGYPTNLAKDGAVNPFNGGVRQAQVQLGQQYGGNEALLGQARSIGNQFITSIRNNPNFNSGKINIGNAITQLIHNQLSDKDFPGIQSQFNNTIAKYAPILGGEANVLNLIQTANPTSMEALIRVLDSQAEGSNSALMSAGTGSGTGSLIPSTPARPSPATTQDLNPSSQAILNKYNIK